MVNLRDYQEECINEILSLPKGERKIVKAPTGSGKTIIMSGLVGRLQGRVLIVVPSTELREQTLDKISMVCGDIDIGSVQGKLNSVSNRIVVATRQSLTHSKSTRMSMMSEYGEFSYILIDESHQAINQQEKLIDGLATDNTVVIGFTATPYSIDIGKIYNGMVYQKHIIEMIDKNYLVEPRAILVQSNTCLDSVKTVAGEFNLGQLEDTLNNNERNELVVDAYLKFAQERKHCLIFATGISHSDSIVDTFRKRNIEAYSVDSSCDDIERDNIINGFKSGKFKVLVNVGILTTGFDMQNLDCIILARCTKSRILYEQILGRGLRTAPDKKDVLIIDIVDVSSKHNLMSMSDVFDIDIKTGETPTEAKERVEKMKEEERIRQEEERRERERRIKEEMELEAKMIDLFNRNMNKAMTNSKLDWFRFDDNTYSLMSTSEVIYTIRKTEDNLFVLYKILNEKHSKNIIEIDNTNSLQEAMVITEELALQHGTSFCKRKTKWKDDLATPNQLKYVQDNCKSWVKTKWDANKYFFNKTLWNLFRKINN